MSQNSSPFRASSTDLQIWWLNFCWEILSGWESVMNLSRPNFKNMTCKYDPVMLSLSYDTLTPGGSGGDVVDVLEKTTFRWPISMKNWTSCFYNHRNQAAKKRLKTLSPKLSGLFVRPWGFC